MIDELSLVLKLIRKSNDNEMQKIIEKISFIFKQNASNIKLILEEK